MTWPDACPHAGMPIFCQPYCCCDLARGFPRPLTGECPVEMGEWGAWRAVLAAVEIDAVEIVDAIYEGVFSDRHFRAEVRKTLDAMGWLP